MQINRYQLSDTLYISDTSSVYLVLHNTNSLHSNFFTKLADNYIYIIIIYIEYNI